MSPPTISPYMFVSGKNWKLSLAELVSYMEARELPFVVSEYSRSFFTLQTEKQLPKSTMDDLGGTLKIAEVAATVPSELFTEAFQKEKKQAKQELKAALPLNLLVDKIPPADSGKALFGVSVYWTDSTSRRTANLIQRFLGSALKGELKAQGKNARFMGFPKNRPQPQLTPVEVLKKGLVENNAEIICCIGRKQTYIGNTLAVHNPFEFQKRDVEKPAQRKIFAIPPRVARIMVNLSHCTSGKVFLDPFCGVGTILLEALLSDAQVLGLDINRWCVEAARRNLAWLKNEYNLENPDYTILQGDARRLTSRIREEVECVATEPDLGPALRDVPTAPYAKKILRKLTPLFQDVLRQVHQVLSADGYLVIVSPYIRVRSGTPVTMDMQQLAADAGFEVVKPFQNATFANEEATASLKQAGSLVDVDERHKIGREIHVLKRR